MFPEFPEFLLRRMLKRYFEEDLSLGEVTGVLKTETRANIISGGKGVIAGVEVARTAFEMFNVDIVYSIGDGDQVEPKDLIMQVEGNSKDIMMAERTILNILMRMSGIATTTSKIVEKAKKHNPPIIVAATRKNTPGFRFLEKMAVRIGGGATHRLSLGDCVLVKDTHVKIAGGVEQAIDIAKKADFTKKIEVEVSSSQDLLLAVEKGVDIVMLDNMSPEEIRQAVQLLQEKGLRDKITIEASGGINMENMEDYASTGVDIISSSFITLYSPPLDLSLEIVDR
ncbi:MAG: carboxylating nicotinate-nucleotide diphosphorylase [Candidatus Hadarchaeota archaeon]